jgi:hypothetical protein
MFWALEDFFELSVQPVSQRSFKHVERRLDELGDGGSGISGIGDRGSWILGSQQLVRAQPSLALRRSPKLGHEQERLKRKKVSH